MAAKQQVKRFRDPLCPKPILDRAAFDKALKANGITLSDNHFDSFYQRLHRSGYPPLDEFVAELRGEVAAEGVSNDDGSVVSVSSTTNFRTKNSISSRPGRKSQLPKALLDFLSNNVAAEAGSDEKFATVTSKVQLHQTSADGTTTKLAVELQDGHVVESVLMRHEGRCTLCVSSQVGCAMGCTFCATGTMGIRGNLSSGEILEQLVHASKILAEESRDNAIMAEEGGTDSKKRQKKQKRMDLIRNIVFMGMGEPLNNYHNVLAACKAMIDRRLWNLAHNRVTVSTVGVTSRMRDLTRDLPEVNLALSLHAPNQQMREKIVPAAKGTPIESLIEALDLHMMALTKRKLLENPQEDDSATDFNVEERQTASKKKRAMIEYVMLTGDTSTIEAAHQLGKLCEGRHLVVNLIPYNKTDVKDLLSCPSEEHMQEFRRIVSSYGSFCSIRRTMGADIAGACGQLVVEEEKKKQVLDIEDGPFAKDIKESRIVAPRRKRTSDTNSSSKQQPTDPRLRQLTIATAITASLFVVSASLLVLQRRKR